MRHEVLADKIHLIIFDTQEDITSTFLRFQEHYESPEFKGKFFSLEEYKTWYIKNSPKGKKTGKFTYYSDWNGFNIPSYILEPFYSGKFSPLSSQENEFLELFKDKQSPFYIIGIHKSIKKLGALLEHEIAHGLFYTDNNYKSEVLKILSKFDIEPIKAWLRSNAGYHEQVLEDECHAYSIASVKELETVIPKDLTRSLKEIYEKYLRLNNTKIPSLE